MAGELPEVNLEDCLANIVSYEDLAEMFGVQKATTWRWRSTGVLPPPDGTVGGRAIWARSTIVEWASRNGRTIIY